MDTYKTQLPARKLKDSCDVCAASKLRCDKQKPMCARCLNSNRPCTYSPARRGGRPHRVRRARSQSRSQSGCQDPNPRPCFQTPDADTTKSPCVKNAERLGPTDREMSCDNAWLASSITIDYHPHQNSRPSSSPCQNVSTSVEPKTIMDCGMLALSIVEQLDTRSPPHSPPPPTHPLHGGRGFTATEACQRLLTILMCPCSEQAEVALLVASGCLSLVDMVHHSAHRSDRSVGPVSSNDSPQQSMSASTSHGSYEQDPPMWTWSRSCSMASDSQTSNQVGELSKIAKVIVQFTERYHRDNTCSCPQNGPGAHWEKTTWVVGPVAALLRCRLQAVTRGVARRLVF
ncbi:hypothetical protein BDW60DRAFT_192186 [Aspergillus nidulans var. acristatus]